MSAHRLRRIVLCAFAATACTQVVAAQHQSSLRFDGMYYARSGSDTYEYFRFYPDGHVVHADSVGTPRQVSRWLRKWYSWLGGTGKYTVREERVRIQVEYHGGAVGWFDGTASGESLELTQHNNKTRFRAKRTYRFLRISLPRETPNQAMQRTASKPASDVWRVCHPRVGYVASCSGLAVADLVSR